MVDWRSRKRRAFAAMRSVQGLLESEAVAFWKASQYSGTGALLDLSGNGHDAQLGSTAGADSNDPFYLIPTGYVYNVNPGTPYLYLPGIVGNDARIPDEAGLNITGNIDLRWYGALDNWTAGVNVGLITKLFSPARINFQVTVANRLVLNVQIGGVDVAFTSNILTLGAGTDNEVRVTFNPTTGAYAFYYRAGGVGAWTGIGSGTTATTGAIDSVAGGLQYIGSQNGTFFPVLGKCYRAQIFASIDGTDKRLDVDFTDLAAYNATRTELTAVTGQTVTINRSASGRPALVVDRPTLSYAVDDYDTLAHNAVFDPGTDSFTAMVAIRKYGNTGAEQFVFGKKNGAGASAAGWGITMTSAGNLSARVSDGATGSGLGSAVISAYDGLSLVAALVIDRDADTITVKAFTADGTMVVNLTPASIATLGGIGAAVALRAGATALANNFTTAAIDARAVFPGRLFTDGELSQLAQELVAL